MSTSAPGLNPEVELLIEQARERAAAALRGRERVATAVAASLLAAGSLALLLVDDRSRSASPWLVAVFVAACAVAARLRFEVAHISVVPTPLVVTPMLFVLPAGVVPLAVGAAYVASVGSGLWRDAVRLRRSAVRFANAWHVLGAASVLVLAGDPAASWGKWPVLLAAFAASCATDFVWGAARGVVVFGMRVRDQATVIGPTYAVDAVLTLTGFCFAIAAVGAPLAGLAGLPLVGLLSSFAQERRTRIDQALELSQAYRGTAFLLGDVVESDDAYTGEHSRRVVTLSLAVADDLRVDAATRRDVELTALLHDVGKIRIPNEIINKRGPLTAEEREVVETHTVEGERLLARVGGLLGEVGRLVRSCHERWDGAGYPDGLAGEQIPLVARIVACADAFEAMTSDRSYADALRHDEAVAEVRRCAGTQFDPRVVEALLRRVGVSSPA